MVNFHQNLSEKALPEEQEVYTVFLILTSLWCNDKSVDVHLLSLDMLMAEGSLHALLCCRLCCYWYQGHGRPIPNKLFNTLTLWDMCNSCTEISSTRWSRCWGRGHGLPICFKEKATCDQFVGTCPRLLCFCIAPLGAVVCCLRPLCEVH